MKQVTIDGLPDDPLAAACVFDQHWLPHIETTLAAGHDVTVAFPAAHRMHGAWRRTIVRELARKYPPHRINGVAGGGEESLEATLAYLESAPGVTGQYLPLHGD